MNLLKYSNGWGHLIMSIVVLAVGLILILLSPPNAGYGIGLVTTVVSAWFISGAAKQVAYESQKTTQETAAQVVSTAVAAQVVQNAAIQTAVQSAVQSAVTPTTPGGNV